MSETENLPFYRTGGVKIIIVGNFLVNFCPSLQWQYYVHLNILISQGAATDFSEVVDFKFHAAFAAVQQWKKE